MASLFGNAAAVDAPRFGRPRRPARHSPAARRRPGPARRPTLQALIDQAARELADYQRLTAEGKLGEAGQRLESLKRILDQLKKNAEAVRIATASLSTAGLLVDSRALKLRPNPNPSPRRRPGRRAQHG